VLESDVSRFCLFSARAYLLRVQINIAENAHTDTYCYKYSVCSFSVLVSSRCRSYARIEHSKNLFFGVFSTSIFGPILLCFFSSFCSIFLKGARGFFFQQQAQNHIRLLIKTDERKEGKDFETFLSLFFPLFDTNNTTTLALTQRQRRRTRAVLFILLPRCKVLYRERQ